MLRVRFQLLLLAFVVLGVYYPTIFAPLCSTDDGRMVDALFNQERFDLFAIFFPHVSGQYYRPVISCSFVADKYLWGLEPSFMHLENLLLHMANSLLVFACTRVLFKAWGRQGSDWGPLVAGLIFALHPINTEAVSWVSGRTDPLAAFFLLVSLWSLGRYLAAPHPVFGALPGPILLVAALAKESAICFVPGALFLLVCWDHSTCRGAPLKARIRRLALPALSILAGGGGYVAMRSAALSVQDKGTAALANLVSGQELSYLVIARAVTKATGFYFKKLFFPLPLNFGIVEVADYYVVLGILFLALLGFLVYRRTLVGALTVSGCCILAPALLLTVSKLSWTPVAERYLYMPCAMFAILVALGAVAVASKAGWGRPLLPGLLFVLLSGSAYATTSRSLLWQDNFELFADTARKSPTFNVAKNDMAAELLKKGKKQEAYSIFASTPSENFQIASLNVVLVLMDQGKLIEARRILYDRLKEGAGYTPEMLRLLVKIAERRRDDAVGPREKAELNRELLQLIRLQYGQGKDPFFQYRLGLVQLQLKDHRGAFSSFSGARGAVPERAFYRKALFQLAERYRP